MALPGQTLAIRDPGLGLVEPSDSRFLFFGTASKGTPNEVVAVSSPAAAVDAFGDGPLAEALAYTLDVAGGPVYGVRLATTVAGAAGAVTTTAVGTSTGTVAVAGAALDRYDAIVEITKTGGIGVGEFRFSLDGGRTWSEPRTIPAGGAFTVPRTGLTLTLADGAGPVFFERGDRFRFASTAPYYSATELGAAFDGLVAYLSTAPDFALDAVILLGRHATGAAAAVLFGALSARLSGLEARYAYVGAIMDAGSGDTRANVKTAFASVADRRIMAVYGDAVVASSKSFAGFAAPLTSAVLPVAARAAAVLPSTSLGRVADGPLVGVSAITHDEYATEELDAAKITTLRTWPSQAGFYVTGGRLKSPVGSDFRDWHHRRVMDVACRTVVRAQNPFIDAELLTRQGGQVDEKEARRIEEIVKDALSNAILMPKNASGRRGYASAIDYKVDRLNNLVATSTLRTSVAIQPLGYSERIETEIGFALNVGT